MKFKFYKTISDGKWYDKSYSEEAELNSPEFGIPEMNKELKAVLDTHEAQHAQQKNLLHLIFFISFDQLHHAVCMGDI